MPAARWLHRYERGVFSTVDEAVRAYVARARADLGQNVDWQRVDEPARPSGEGR